MDEKKTFVIKKPDELAEIIRAGQAGDSSPMEAFLQDPFAVIAQMTTDLLAHGPVAFAGPAVRVVQAALKGRLFQQFAKEVEGLREKGKLDGNFAESKYGYQSWVELLTVIDDDSPDEDRLEALKAMFFSINRINATDAEQILGYQLFQIAKRLTSNELLVLKAVYELHKAGRFKETSPQSVQLWADLVAKHLGHRLVALIDHADSALVDNRLLMDPRTPISIVQQGRLTDLGIAFCENIEHYRLERSE